MLGRPNEALGIIRDVHEILEQKGEPWNQFRMLVAADIGVSLRCAGYYAEAGEQSERVLQKYPAVLGETHRELAYLHVRRHAGRPNSELH